MGLFRMIDFLSWALPVFAGIAIIIVAQYFFPELADKLLDGLALLARNGR